jgi:hypothetical protein
MKLIRAAVLTVLAATPPMAGSVARATLSPDVLGTVALQINSYYPGLGGGEFTAYFSSPGAQAATTGYYASPALVNGGFETFCLETGVDFYPGQSYYYSLGYTTQPASPSDPGIGSGLSLSTGAAWLYYEFGNGLLSGYDYNSPATPGSQRLADDNLLQAAIWMFQGGQTYGGYDQSPDAYYNAAVAALGGLSNADSPYTGPNVEVLQMWNSSNGTGAAQNQLILTAPDPFSPFSLTSSVPDGGQTAGLLGGSLVGLLGLRRKFFV